MGIEKSRMEEGYSSCGDLTVCASCFGNKALKEYIGNYGASIGCSFCENTVAKSCDLNSVVSHIVSSIYQEWNDPASAGVGYESAEGGYLLDTTSTYELLVDGTLEIDIQNDELLDMINSSIINTDWVRNDPYSLEENVMLIYSWDKFSEFVKYNSRFVLFNQSKEEQNQLPEELLEPERLLESLGKFINRHQLFKTLSQSEKIYRVRIVNKNITLSSAKDVCSPPREYTTLANRMSPAGISMFYGAFEVNTAIKETYEKEEVVTKKAIYGIFYPARPLNVVDLSIIPPVPSLFDENEHYNRASLGFLNEFIIDFCKPIEREDRAHIDYVPTQVVTEYFRHVFLSDSDDKIDGIVYPSSKNPGEKCVVIFANSTQCDEIEYNYGDEQLLVLSEIREKQLTNKVSS